MLWQVLIQFIFRLAFGLAAAMAITPPRWVTSGFYRVHLWVLLGLNTFIVAAVLSSREQFPHWKPVAWTAAVGAVVSYFGAVAWLYEKIRPGMALLSLVAVINMAGALIAPNHSGRMGIPSAWSWLDIVTSATILGTTFSAMLLGHWYLNTPTMQMAPLKRLITMVFVAVVARSAVAAAGLIVSLDGPFPDKSFYALLALRWLSGLIGVCGLAIMSWQTLKIPNTQSATGILYVAVIFVFLGELTSQLLSVQTAHPL